MDELTIQKLLDGDIDPVTMREELLAIGRQAVKEPYMEGHHVEPEREEVIYLTQLQHLAIHICVAHVTPTRSNYAKVLAFVKPFPGGGFRRIITLDTPGLTKRLTSFGQKGGDGKALTTHPNSIARRANPTPAQLLIRSRFGEIGAAYSKSRKGLSREDPITWGDKISEAMSSLPRCSCLVCHQEMAAHEGNIAQHQSGPKCIPPEHYVMSCVHCGKGFRSNNNGTLTRHQRSNSCRKSM